MNLRSTERCRLSASSGADYSAAQHAVTGSVGSAFDVVVPEGAQVGNVSPLLIWMASKPAALAQTPSSSGGADMFTTDPQRGFGVRRTSAVWLGRQLPALGVHEHVQALSPCLLRKWIERAGNEAGQERSPSKKTHFVESRPVVRARQIAAVRSHSLPGLNVSYWRAGVHEGLNSLMRTAVALTFVQRLLIVVEMR